MISVYRPSEWNGRCEITLEAAAKIVGVIPMTALRMIKRRDLTWSATLPRCAVGNQGPPTWRFLRRG
jgi:hypothetical protein